MKILISIMLVVFCNTAIAQKNPFASAYSMPSIEFGFKSNTATISGSSSDKQENGFQLGFSGVFNFTESIGMKSGLFYAERPFAADFGGGSTVKGKITYFEVPALLMFKLEEYAGIYAGPSLALKLGDEISSGSLIDVKTMVMPITLGVQFKFLPNFGVNAFFETISGDLANGISNSRAVGVNFLVSLD